MFQEGRLFPHLTVRQNLLFGRWFAPAPRRAAVELDDVVDLLGIGRCSTAARPAVGRREAARRDRPGVAGEPAATADGRAAGLARCARARTRSCPISKGCATRRACRSSMSATPSRRSARLATTIVLISEGRVRAAGPVEEVMGRAGLYPLAGRFEAGAVLGGARCSA